MLYGPFAQILTLEHLNPAGPLRDEDLRIISNGGIVVKDGIITAVGNFDDLRSTATSLHAFDVPMVALPGLIDAHTHVCYAGSRANDYALRCSGLSYKEIAARGGGILDTVRKTRTASRQQLVDLLIARCARQMAVGITTCEVKSGYGLTVQDEIKILEAIDIARTTQPLSLVSTCLAAHTCPEEFHSKQDYLHTLATDLLPQVRQKKLACRVDIFVDEVAFSTREAHPFLTQAKQLGFAITIHADQFSRGGARLAASVGAISADHLEVSTPEDAIAMKDAQVAPIVLPGATLGLGTSFPPARMLLDHGLPLAIASDWNPGSAPMGDLLIQAALLGIAQKMSMAETWAAITVRAAAALGFKDRGILAPGMRADIACFPCNDYREILYRQGSLRPNAVVIHGKIYQQNPIRG